MANVVTTNYFRQQLSRGLVDLSATDYAVALMNIYVQSATETTLKAISAWAEVSAYEASAVGYSATPITSQTVSAVGNNIVWDGANITWSSITSSPYGYAIYKISNGLLVGFVEFTSAPLTAVNGDITITWNANGIANII